MILKFICRGGLAALSVLVFAAGLLVDSGWLPGVIFVPLTVAATVLLRRIFAWPPYALLRDIDRAVPDGNFHVLLNRQEGVRFLVTRLKRPLCPCELKVGRFTDRDISESYGDANLGASVTTIPVDLFEIHGRAAVARTHQPLIATFKPFDGGMIVSLAAPPEPAGATTYRAAVRAVVSHLRFKIRSGVNHVSDEEMAELAGQLRGASIDPNVP